MKIDKNITAALIIASAIVWHSESQKYQIINLPKGHFAKINIRTGNIQEVCGFRENYCAKWNGLKLADKEDFYDAYLEKRMKEEGLSPDFLNGEVKEGIKK